MTTIERVRDLMTVGVPTCTPDTPVVDLARRILQDNLEGLVVLDAEGHAVGVVGRDQLVQAYTRPDRDLTAEAVMDEQVPQVPPDIPLAAAAQIMQDLGVRVVYLVHNADGITYPAAQLTYTHLLRHLAESDPQALNDLGIHADREPPLTTFFKRRDEARRRASSKDSS